jgi:hypothetical protein
VTSPSSESPATMTVSQLRDANEAEVQRLREDVERCRSAVAAKANPALFDHHEVAFLLSLLDESAAALREARAAILEARSEIATLPIRVVRFSGAALSDPDIHVRHIDRSEALAILDRASRSSLGDGTTKDANA